MRLSEVQIKMNFMIPTSEIQADIDITKKEIDDFEKELTALRENPTENKVEIYFREGKILKRKEFVDELIQILEYRKVNDNPELIK